MNPVPDADGAPSPLLSNQDRKEVEKQYEDAEKRLHRAAKNLDEATSNEETADQLKQVHRQSLRMLIYGAHLGKPKDEVQNLLNELLLKNPSTPQPNSVAVDTLSPLEVAVVYRHLASPDLLESLAITGDSPIGDIACSMVRTAVNSTAVLMNGLKDDDEPKPSEEVIGHYSLEQLLFSLHMVDQSFLDTSQDTSLSQESRFRLKAPTPNHKKR
ncbi:MAG: hypothetical protein DMG96_12400 [Acidobacteria bacterium]|nr:MAG: hypothetical protein DMG96_12400 [Acidobacteriota bacterium]